MAGLMPQSPNNRQQVKGSFMVCNHNSLKTLASLGLALVLFGGVFSTAALAENEGQDDLEEAIRVKVTATGIRDLNQAVKLLQQALDKGLELEDAEFAEELMSSALLERATALVRVINARSINNPQIQQVRQLVISDLRRVLAYDNPSPQAYFELGRMLAMPGGDPHEARRVLTTYLETPDLPDAQRAEAYIIRSRVQTDDTKAMADFDEALRLAPQNAGYRLVRALYLRSRSKFAEALKEVDLVLQQTPDDANALILQGEVYRELGKLEEALASFNRATELAPKAPTPFQNRGEIYREQEDFEKAIAEFNEVLKLQPGVPRTLLHRSEALFYSGKLEEALSDVDAVLEKQPLVAAHRLRAEILAKLDRLQEAIDEMERVSEAMPQQIEVLMQLALYYLVDEQPQKAIEAYSKVIKADETSVLAWRSRGDTYLNIGQHPEAIADLQHALDLDPENSSILNNLAWVLATSPQDEVRDAKRAIELATKACEQSEYGQSHILSTLAAAYAEAGEFETAIKWSQKAVDMEDPEHGAQLAAELASYREDKPWRENQAEDSGNSVASEGPVPPADTETPE